MNRDIEFRGRTVILEWQYGFYTMIGNKHYICTPKGKNGVVQYCIDDENTIGQYTGLKDKNGNKIFEGDILRTPAWLYGEEKVCICKYNQENNVNSIIGFGLYTNDAYFKKYQELVECDEWDEFEVIGNIYENKELLEGEIC